jgi:hypothetical protein
MPWSQIVGAPLWLDATSDGATVKSVDILAGYMVDLVVIGIE